MCKHGAIMRTDRTPDALRSSRRVSDLALSGWLARFAASSLCAAYYGPSKSAPDHKRSGGSIRHRTPKRHS